jgi:hypothetical protein
LLLYFQGLRHSAIFDAVIHSEYYNHACLCNALRRSATLVLENDVLCHNFLNFIAQLRSAPHCKKIANAKTNLRKEASVPKMSHVVRPDSAASIIVVSAMDRVI